MIENGNDSADRPATTRELGNELFAFGNYDADKADVLVKRCNEIFSLNWNDFAKNYALGYLALHLTIKVCGVEGRQHLFSFLIVKNGVVLADANVKVGHLEKAKVRANAKTGGKIGNDLNQVLPVLVGVGDLVEGPEERISSGVWLVGHNEAPLIGREFLFYSTLYPCVWKRTRLPVLVQSTEWEPYARYAPPILPDEGDNHFIQRRSEMADYLDRFESDVERDIFLDACDYVDAFSFNLCTNTVRLRADKIVNGRYEIVELSLSSFDLFT